MGDDAADPPDEAADGTGRRDADGESATAGDAESSTVDDTPDADGGNDDARGVAEEGVSDAREKHISVLLPDGEAIERGNVYVEHTASTFAFSEDPEFPEEETTRVEKSEVVRVEVKQHHSTCFITTAVADEGPTLGELRTFRDEGMARSAPGRVLVALYERVSPPVAASLERNPGARPTRAVRWLVRRCGRLARRHRTARGPRRAALAFALVALYVGGLTLGVAAHACFALAGR